MQEKQDQIEIVGASENNLKHIDVAIPKGELVVFVGVSGSGKSSLVFDTIAVESAREWQASYPLYLRNKMPHYEKPAAQSIKGLTPAIVIDQRALGAGARSTVGTAVDVAPLLRLLFSRVGRPSAGGSMAYSFNHPLGMCPECSGLAQSLNLDEDSLFDEGKSINEGAIKFSQFSAGWQAYLYKNNPLLDPDKKLSDFSEREREILRLGVQNPPKIEFRSNNTGRIDRVEYEGVISRFKRLYLNRDISKLKKSLQDEILSHVRKGPCKNCGGTGLNPAALASKINGKNIVDYGNMAATELLAELKNINDPLGISLANQISAYLERMIEVGVGYLSLSRRSDTLSGGEAQRIKIVRNLGSSLSNITYIFDEPTAGLHPADAERIGAMLLSLRDKRNNILVVEHNPQIVSLAGRVIEIGPLAGSRGGEIVFQGSLQELKDKDTLTAQMLKQKVNLNLTPLAFTQGFEIKNACANNLKSVSVTIPKGVLTAISGVAGSGKSSLCGEFIKRFPQAVKIDQKPLGAQIRSTPATYTGVMDEIRKLFAKANGVDAGWFSPNSKGACPACGGTGQISYDMAFAEPVTLPCEECGGRRYNQTALSYAYKELNIEQATALTIDQALEFFESEKIKAPLRSLNETGLGYLTLSQPTSTLSGGEAQRVKLAAYLHKSGEIYVLDEPSTGLHGKDVENLAQLLKKLVGRGNTVIIIEHKLSLIAQADWVIDMGPGGGNDGGEILFCGTPAQLIKCAASKTGKYLRESL